jgi:predicted transcriptional regulator
LPQDYSCLHAAAAAVVDVAAAVIVVAAIGVAAAVAATIGIEPDYFVFLNSSNFYT